MDHRKGSTLSAVWTLMTPRLQKSVLRLALLVAPLAIAFTWGVDFDDSAYVALRYARDLAYGRWLDPVFAAGRQALPASPLYTLALLLPAALGIPLPQASLFLSALGWGAMAVTMHMTGEAVRRPLAGATSAVLAILAPAMVSALGTEITWTVALAGITLLSSVKRWWKVEAIALALMLWMHLGVSTLAMALLLLIVQWIDTGHFPLWPSAGLSIAVLGWGLATLWLTTPSLSVPSIYAPQTGFANLSDHITRLLGESEFYWLFLPFAGVGLLGVTTRARWALVLWGAASVLSGDRAVSAMSGTLGLFLTGLGIDQVIRWAEKRKSVRLDPLRLARGLTLVAGLPLVVAEASSFTQRYRFRPLVRHQLEQIAGDWLRTHTEPTATVLSTQRVGYIADRHTLPWLGEKRDESESASLVESLAENPAEYSVSFRSIAWDRVRRSHWFQDSYETLARFESPYDATSPFVVWGYRHRPMAIPVGADLGGAIRLVSYAAPENLSPGQGFDVRLYWQAIQPPRFGYVVFVHLLNANGQLAASHDGPPMEGQCPTWTWLPGQIIPDVHHLELKSDASGGPHRLQVGMYEWPSLERLPVRDSQGMEQPDRLIVLQAIDVQ